MPHCLKLVPPLSKESDPIANQEDAKEVDKISEEPGWFPKIDRGILRYRKEIGLILGIGAIISALAYKIPPSLDQDIKNDQGKNTNYQSWLKSARAKNGTDIPKELLSKMKTEAETDDHQ